MSETREELWTVHPFGWSDYRIKIYDTFPHDVYVVHGEDTPISLTRYVKGTLRFEVLKGLASDAVNQMEKIAEGKSFVTAEESYISQQLVQLLARALLTETFGAVTPVFPKSQSHLESCDPFNCKCSKLTK